MTAQCAFFKGSGPTVLSSSGKAASVPQRQHFLKAARPGSPRSSSWHLEKMELITKPDNTKYKDSWQVIQKGRGYRDLGADAKDKGGPKAHETTPNTRIPGGPLRGPTSCAHSGPYWEPNSPFASRVPWSTPAGSSLKTAASSSFA